MDVTIGMDGYTPVAQKADSATDKKPDFISRIGGRKNNAVTAIGASALTGLATYQMTEPLVTSLPPESTALRMIAGTEPHTSEALTFVSGKTRAQSHVEMLQQTGAAEVKPTERSRP